MKKSRLLIYVLFAAMLVCGCTNTENPGSETAIPSASVSTDPFVDVDDIYMDVLNDYAARGYALIDLDGNGSDELLITDGEQIYELYVICDDGQLHKKLEYSRYIVKIQLCSDNRIFVHETDYNGCNYYYIYALDTKAGNLPLELCVIQEDDRWWSGPNEKDTEPTTEAAAMSILEKIDFQEIDFIPFC